MKVFVTDAGYKHTLGAVRALGKRGIYVLAGSESNVSQSFYSKYCKDRIVYPNPGKEMEFTDFLLDYVKNNSLDVLLPIGYLATTALSKRKEDFEPYVKLPIADYSSMEIAADKYRTLIAANQAGVKTPRLLQSAEEIATYPIVVKGLIESGKVSYVNSAEELLQHKLGQAIIQEYIPGEGYGFFALFNRGKARAIFMHKRVREYPITGGPSTVAESIYDPQLKKIGLKLLESLNWHGVAMVEFKKDPRDGDYKLMEINPKFWGSLDLAIASGVDFPYLTVKMAYDGDVDPVFSYKTGIKFRWLFPDDILHLLSNPSSLRSFLSDFRDKDTKTNVWLEDIKPNLYQICATPYHVMKHWKNGNFKYPHGKPEESNR
jgi:predicted ATP-grasp superfamily ATP-dependent carboligase